MGFAHVNVTGPEGEPLGSWTTTDSGEHIPDKDPHLCPKGGVHELDGPLRWDVTGQSIIVLCRRCRAEGVLPVSREDIEWGED